MGEFTIREIATALDVPCAGDDTITVTGAAEPAAARPDQLAVAMLPAYSDALAKGSARAAILWDGADWQALGLQAAVFVKRPRRAMAALTGHLAAGSAPPPGIHPTALIDDTARIGEGASIGPYTCIGPDVRIGARACIGAHVSVAGGASIGDDCRLEAGTRIGRNVVIGDRFHAMPGVVIGADGFSYVTPEKSAVETVRETLGADTGGAPAQAWRKIASLGGVEIGDDVDCGANACIDAGTIRPTRVGDGTKIDNLVHVGHNVVVGRNCLLCGLVGIAGSAVIGDGVVLGGQAGVADNVTVGDGVIAGGATKIMSNVPAGRAVLGYPAVRMESHIESYKALRRLPRILRELKSAKKPVSKTRGKD